MNYIAMIQNRRSVRAFRSKEVSDATLAELRTHYERNCRRLMRTRRARSRARPGTSSSSSARRTI